MKDRMIGVLGLLFLATSVLGFYSPSDDVIELNPNNFNQKVISSDELWLVEFYAPWCGHCRNLAPEWKKAATALKGVVKVAAVDADAHKELGGRYGVRGFPTIKVFGLDKNKAQDYNGPREANGIVKSALDSAQQMVNARLSGKSGGGKSSGGSGGSGSGDKKDVVELTDANFEKTVLGSEDMWLVEFYAPWCGHCKRLEPEWASAASQLKGKVKLGALDATQHTVMSNRYGVQGFPTIKMFAAGKKPGPDGDPQEYDGGRTASDIVAWANDKVAANVEPPDVYQITDSETLKSSCEDHQLCIVSVLPHILDCQSKCRNEYITMLKQLGEKFKRQQWGWLWSEAGQQPDLESSLDIGGFGYPALAAVNIRKAKFSLLRGSFSQTGINEFLRDLSYGKGSTAPLKNAKLPDIQKVDKWDGKDGVFEDEEDIDLSDVKLDDEL